MEEKDYKGYYKRLAEIADAENISDEDALKYLEKMFRQDANHKSHVIFCRRQKLSKIIDIYKTMLILLLPVYLIVTMIISLCMFNEPIIESIKLNLIVCTIIVSSLFIGVVAAVLMVDAISRLLKRGDNNDL